MKKRAEELVVGDTVILEKFAEIFNGEWTLIDDPTPEPYPRGHYLSFGNTPKEDGWVVFFANPSDNDQWVEGFVCPVDKEFDVVTDSTPDSDNPEASDS